MIDKKGAMVRRVGGSKRYARVGVGGRREMGGCRGGVGDGVNPSPEDLGKGGVSTNQPLNASAQA